MKVVDVIVAILLVIGGLNWGSIGLFGFNFVEFIFGYPDIFGHSNIAIRIIYILVGLAALWQIFQWKAIQRRWR